MRQFLARCLNFFRRRGAEADMAREIESHLALLQENFEARGLSPQQAAVAARRTYGGIEQSKELHREARSFLWIEHVVKDIRYGARNLVRTPGFTLIAVLALGLGIGANTAIFGVVNAVLLRSLPYRDAGRLVTILHDGIAPVATANYLDWRNQSHSFEAVGAADFWSPNLTSSDPSDPHAAEHLYALKVTQNMLRLLGVDPLLGRFFLPGEDQKGADTEVILSYRLWQRRFAGDRNVLEKLISLNGRAYTIVGVMPASFQFAPFWATHAELWAPDDLTDTLYQRGGNHLRVFARLKAGMTLAQARADMDTVTASLERRFPATNRTVMVRPLMENVVGKIETPLLMMLGAVGFVLLIACANVAHMLLARTSDRQKEIAVRVAIGAGKARILAQFLTENLLLSLTGAAAGLLLALAGTKVLVALSPAYIPRVDTVGIDSKAIIFLVGITLLTTLAFGLAPALHAATSNLNDALKHGGRADTDGRRRTQLRSFLVASEFALAFVLLIGAGLMVRSFYALESVSPGFNPHDVLSLVVSVAGTREAEPSRRAVFYRDLLAKIRSLPGVNAVGAINHLPLEGDLWTRGFEIQGRPKPRPGEGPNAAYRIIMPGYFQTMRLPLRNGRDITYQDDGRSSPVVILNERAAEVYWPRENPIGKRIVILGENSARPNWLTVIGVVANAKQDDWASNIYPEMYLPGLQTPEFLGAGDDPIAAHMTYITVVVRSVGDPVALASAVEQTVHSFDRNLPISQVVTMDRAVKNATAQPRFEMLLLALFGIVALVLAAIGIYGVMNYVVSRRTREIGIRMSLGASRRDVLRLLVLHALLQALAGTVVGIIGAVLLSNVMTKMLYGVRATDPLTFVSVLALLIVTALLATGLPARKATRIDPVLALRSE